MNITDITQISGYTIEDYETLKAECVNAGVTEEVLKNSLILMAENGANFQTLMKSIETTLPALPAPTASTSSADLPSSNDFAELQAKILALITETANEERRQTRENKIAQQDSYISSLQDQAQDLEDMAGYQLGFGIATGLVTVGIGLASAGASIKGFSNAKAQANTAKADALAAGMTQVEAANAYSSSLTASTQLLSAKVSGFSQAAQGANSALGSIGQYEETMAQAEQKKHEADAAQKQQAIEVSQELIDSLSAVIQKAQSTMDAILTANNQTRARILG